MINYAGQRNGRYDTPPLLSDLHLGISGGAPREVRALRSGQAVRLSEKSDGTDRLWYDLPPVGAFEALLLVA